MEMTDILDGSKKLLSESIDLIGKDLTHIAALSGANVTYKPALVKNGTRFCNQNL
jgi:hypothetical protein